MDAVRYQRVKQVLVGALERVGEQRQAYLDEACAGDESLRAEVDALLAEESSPAPVVEKGLVAPSIGHALAQAVELFVTGTGAPNAPDSWAEWLEPGATIEQFELIREIGRGGVGRVFLARDTKLGRRVALKFLQVNSPQLKERFLVEAKATAQCHHENIVVVHQVGEARGIPYLALEYLDGEPLAKMLGGRALSPTRAIELITPVLRALGRAHDAGIVHRDLKPENIFVTRRGLIKVLDFGIAKLFDSAEADLTTEAESSRLPSARNRSGFVGTPAYMAPEQWSAGDIDHRTDLWAVGIILWQMLAGRHPLRPITGDRLKAIAARFDEPMPDIGEAVPAIPDALAKVINACLNKDKDQRPAAAAILLDELHNASPRPVSPAKEISSPYPGMSAFQELDAERFFGRQRDVEALLQRLEQQSMVGVIGPSGVGKSSFVRAGVIPALKRSHDLWEVLVTRPARDPVGGLAALLESEYDDEESLGVSTSQEIRARLYAEPGYLGKALRARARTRRSNILLFVDQFEELYTQVDDRSEQQVYRACLAAVADDPSSPLRVIISVRSDLFDRLADDRDFIDRLSAGLSFLPPLDRAAMRDALVEPLQSIGYAFDPPVVDAMLDALEEVPGGLPLLQFTAAQLWDQRDPDRRRLTAEQYEAMGGVTGTLASYADALVFSLSPAQQNLLRRLLPRLVTSDGTRALADVDELVQLSASPGEVGRLIDALVRARLVTVHAASGDGATAVELVHESLIEGWPALRRWVEATKEQSGFVEQLRLVAKQWSAKGRPEGLVWRGKSADEALRFRTQYGGELTANEQAYIAAIEELATRAARRNRRWVAAGFVTMALLVVGAMLTVVSIRRAEQVAQQERRRAEQQARRSQAAERRIRHQLETIQQQQQTIKETEVERALADAGARKAEKKAADAEQKQRFTYEQLEQALERARRLTRSERAARKEAEQLTREKQTRIRGLEEELSRLATRLD